MTLWAVCLLLGFALGMGLGARTEARAAAANLERLHDQIRQQERENREFARALWRMVTHQQKEKA